MTVHTRRGFFKSVSATAATAALPATALAYQGPVTDDPIPDWFEKWKRLQHAVDKGGLQYDDHMDELEGLSEKICTTQPVSRAGLIAQLEYAMDDFGPYITGNIWKDLDVKLFNNLLAALKGGSV